MGHKRPKLVQIKCLTHNFCYEQVFERKSRNSAKEISIGTSKIICKYQLFQYINFFL